MSKTLFGRYDGSREVDGNNWMIMFSVLALLIVLGFSFFFPEQDEAHGLNIWHFMGELEARMVKIVIGLCVIFFVCVVLFGPRAIQERVSPFSDELRDVIELNKIVYQDTDEKQLLSVLPTINIATLAMAIHASARWLGIAIILAALMRLA